MCMILNSQWRLSHTFAIPSSSSWPSRVTHTTVPALRCVSSSPPKCKLPILQSPTEPPPQPPSAVASLAQSLRSHASRTTETYVAFGATMKLFEVCSAQADYKIPQAAQKGVEVPKTANGEDLGVGKGWWYEGSLRSNTAMRVADFSASIDLVDSLFFII